MTDWVRLWHDMPTDPKWRTIARKSGQRVGDVIAVFNFVMVNASGNASERGTLSNLDIEDVATALDLNDDDVQSILDAMQGKVIDGDRLTGWDKRQPKREDSSASQRKEAWKERKKSDAERNGTQRNATERQYTETETETDKEVVTDVTTTRARKSTPKKFAIQHDWQPEILPPEYQAMVDLWPPGRLELEVTDFREYWIERNEKRPGWNRTWRARVKDQHERILKGTSNGHRNTNRTGSHADDEIHNPLLRAVIAAKGRCDPAPPSQVGGFPDVDGA